jgi:hypothetical protein
MALSLVLGYFFLPPCVTDWVDVQDPNGARERLIAAVVRRLGGKIEYGNGVNEDHVVGIDLSNSKVPDAGVFLLRDCAYLQRLGLANTSITDQGLAYVQELQALRAIDLYSVKTISDKGMKYLAQGRLREIIDLQVARIL